MPKSRLTSDGHGYKSKENQQTPLNHLRIRFAEQFNIMFDWTLSPLTGRCDVHAKQHALLQARCCSSTMFTRPAASALPSQSAQQSVHKESGKEHKFAKRPVLNHNSK
jgi:hypothetical protein